MLQVKISLSKNSRPTISKIILIILQIFETLYVKVSTLNHRHCSVNSTRNSAVAERPRDASYHWIFR